MGWFYFPARGYDIKSPRCWCVERTLDYGTGVIQSQREWVETAGWLPRPSINSSREIWRVAAKDASHSDTGWGVCVTLVTLTEDWPVSHIVLSFCEYSQVSSSFSTIKTGSALNLIRLIHSLPAATEARRKLNSTNISANKALTSGSKQDSSWKGH